MIHVPRNSLWRLLVLLAATTALATSCSRSQNNSSDGSIASTAPADPVLVESSTEVPDADADHAEEGKVTTSPKPVDTLPSGREAVISLEAVGLVSPRHLEPSKYGWDVEIINDNISSQLKTFSKLINHPKQLDAEQFVELVDAGFRCGPLRPVDLTTAFEDSSLIVRRAKWSPGSEEPIYQGPSGFAAALRDLLRPFETATEIRSKFKIFQIHEADDDATSLAYFELSGNTALGVAQQRAVWECRWSRPADTSPRLASLKTTQYEEAIGKIAAGALFADCTEAVLGANSACRDQLGYSINHWLDRIEHRFGIDPAGWLGLAIGDVNGDGLHDLYLCEPGGLPNRMFVQNADGTATDIAAQAGVDWLDNTQAALIVDFDNDSKQDLVVATKAGVIFMSGDGQGSFRVRGAKLIPEASPYSLSAADFDHDGDLDLYACCYSIRVPEKRFLQRPVPYHDANNGGRNVLYRNDGQWGFADATEKAGLDHNNRRFSYASSWDDFDNDGDLDLYVANDFGRNNLYRNDGGRFIDVAGSAGVEDIAAGMSVSWGDYNNDGWMDLYVSNMFSSAGNRIAYQRRFHANASESTRSNFQRHARGNSLFQNAGDGTFRDVSRTAGVTMGRWAWGSQFVDLNNDGLEDILVANGFITQEDPGDL